MEGEKNLEAASLRPIGGRLGAVGLTVPYRTVRLVLQIT